MGLSLLRYSWGQQSKKSFYSWAAWAFIVASFAFWAEYFGDRGVAVGLCLFILFALAFLLFQMLRPQEPQKRKNVKEKQLVKEVVPAKTVAKGTATFFYLCLGFGFWAFFTALGVHELMTFTGFHASNSLVAALFLFPIIWASFAAYYLTGAGRLKKSLKIAVWPLASVLLLVLGN